MRLAPIWFLVFALAGEWVTTEPGTRVCRLQQTIVYGMILTPSFCADWQAPFRAPQYGETIPLDQGWWRRAPGGDGYQIHTEKGWVP